MSEATTQPELKVSEEQLIELRTAVQGRREVLLEVVEALHSKGVEGLTAYQLQRELNEGHAYIVGSLMAYHAAQSGADLQEFGVSFMAPAVFQMFRSCPDLQSCSAAQGLVEAITGAINAAHIMLCHPEKKGKRGAVH